VHPGIPRRQRFVVIALIRMKKSRRLHRCVIGTYERTGGNVVILL
jgi:hypothetical protein